MILNGTKIWEIRRRNTLIRERIALGNTKTKCVVGYARIVDSKEMTLEELRKHNDKHHANDFLDKYAKGKKTLFAWVLDNVEVEKKTKPYSHSTGPWCAVFASSECADIKFYSNQPKARKIRLDCWKKADVQEYTGFR